MSYRDVLESSFEVKATGGGLVVSVRFELHASISENGGVVAPGGFGQVHVKRTTMESRLHQRKGMMRKDSLILIFISAE